MRLRGMNEYNADLAEAERVCYCLFCHDPLRGVSHTPH